MKILNLLIVSASIIANFGINSSCATDNIINNQINIAVQPQIQTIKIGYDDVQLSNDDIKNFELKLKEEFLSEKNNKFANFDDLKFAPTSLGKLVESFNDEIKNEKYANNKSEITKIQEVFLNIFNEIVDKENDYNKAHNLTTEQLVELNGILGETKDKISVSINNNANEIKILNNNNKRKIRKFKRIQESSKTIDINYKDVKLSKQGIRNIRLNLYESFFSKDNNKFKSYEDLMFAPTFLGKLVTHFHDQVRTGQYINNRIEIRRIKNVFSSILDNIIKKTTESINKNSFTKKETDEISKRISMASETIKISNKRNAPRIKMWDNIH